MTQGITEERKAALLEKIQQYQNAGLEEKEVELLCGILQSETMLKALGQIVAMAKETPQQILNFVLTTPEGLDQGIRTQGFALGLLNAIECLYALITLPEETSDDNAQPSE